MVTLIDKKRNATGGVVSSPTGKVGQTRSTSHSVSIGILSQDSGEGKQNFSLKGSEQATRAYRCLSSSMDRIAELRRPGCGIAGGGRRPGIIARRGGAAGLVVVCAIGFLLGNNRGHDATSFLFDSQNKAVPGRCQSSGDCRQ